MITKWRKSSSGVRGARCEPWSSKLPQGRAGGSDAGRQKTETASQPFRTIPNRSRLRKTLWKRKKHSLSEVYQKELITASAFFFRELKNSREFCKMDLPGDTNTPLASPKTRVRPWKKQLREYQQTRREACFFFFVEFLFLLFLISSFRAFAEGGEGGG